MDHAVLVTNTTPERLAETIFAGVDKKLRVFEKNFRPTAPDELMTIKETASFLKISLNCIHVWVKKGILKPKKIGNRTYFSRKEILEQLNNS